jgi:hypothetical protein
MKYLDGKGNMVDTQLHLKVAFVFTSFFTENSSSNWRISSYHLCTEKVSLTGAYGDRHAMRA